jgi:hypothetical protein
MRRLLIASCFGVAIAAAALPHRAAAEAPRTPPPRVVVRSGPGAFVSAFAPTPAAGYQGGPLTLDVAVLNERSEAAKQIQVQFFAPGAGLFAQTIDVDANATKKVAFADSVGMSALCLPKTYTVQLEGAGVDTARKTRSFEVIANCTFQASVDNPWSQMEPDRVADAQDHYLTTPTAVVEGEQTCAAPLKVKVSVWNRSGYAANGIRVELHDVKTVAVARTAPFDVAKGGSRDVLLQADYAVGGKMTVALVDPTSSVHGKVINQGLAVNVLARCALSTKEKAQ